MVRSFLLSLVLLFSLTAFAGDFPKLKLPVVDETSILTKQEVGALNRRIINFQDTTSNQIAILITNDLRGYEISEFTIGMGHATGVGNAELDNGVAIVIVPKTKRSRGQMFIAAGYGLEGAIPDALAKRIVDNEFIPSFKQNDYYGGIIRGLDVIMQLAAGEISVQEYQKRRSKKSKGWPILIVIGVVFFLFLSRARGVYRYGQSNNLGFWAAWALLSASNRGHAGYYNDFSSGGGSFGGGGFGGGGGGFGGFGGGGFGGGGAGGSW